MSSVRLITLGSTKFSNRRLEATTATSMMAAVADSALAEGDDHGQSSTQERADVGDVTADEVDHQDREDQGNPSSSATNAIKAATMADMMVRPRPYSRRVAKQSPRKPSTSSCAVGPNCATTDRLIRLPSFR